MDLDLNICLGVGELDEAVVQNNSKSYLLGYILGISCFFPSL